MPVEGDLKDSFILYDYKKMVLGFIPNFRERFRKGSRPRNWEEELINEILKDKNYDLSKTYYRAAILIDGEAKIDYTIENNIENEMLDPRWR